MFQFFQNNLSILRFISFLKKTRKDSKDLSDIFNAFFSVIVPPGRTITFSIIPFLFQKVMHQKEHRFLPLVSM